MTPPARTPKQRKQDTLDRLDNDVDVWVATAEGGTPYMVPLSFLWDGASLLLATPAASPTGRNLRSTGRTRLGIGPTRDVVTIGEPCGGQGRRRVPDGVPAGHVGHSAELAAPENSLQGLQRCGDWLRDAAES
jgi:hypothetical protein